MKRKHIILLVLALIIGFIIILNNHLKSSFNAEVGERNFENIDKIKTGMSLDTVLIIMDTPASSYIDKLYPGINYGVKILHYNGRYGSSDVLQVKINNQVDTVIQVIKDLN